MGIRMRDSSTPTTRFELRSRSNMHPNPTTTSLTVHFDGYDVLIQQLGIYQCQVLFPRIAKLHKEEYNYDDYM